MKADTKAMVEVLRKVADNIESGININDQIQVKYEGDDWADRTTSGLHFVEDVLYRIKPKTTIVNGVEIPKPLEDSEISDDLKYYYVANYKAMFEEDLGRSIKKDGVLFVYKTQEEAIEAYKKLFGIE